MNAALSLDEIIKRKNIRPSYWNRPNIKQKASYPLGDNKKYSVDNNRINNRPVADARNTIIQKNRAKIHDARDKLAQIARRSGDARFKLMKKMVGTRPGKYTKPRPRRPVNTAFDATRYLAADTDDMMDIDDHVYVPPSVFLRRTVKNDKAHLSMPPIPNFDTSKSYHSLSRTTSRSQPTQAPWLSDPFDCYVVPVRQPIDTNPGNYLRKITNDNYERKSPTIPFDDELPYTSRSYMKPIDKMYKPIENSHLSREMKTRLERAPISNGEPAGIFSNPYKTRTVSQKEKDDGYRIVVSNLHTTVSQNDIKELFEDVGELLEARLVRPGVAEVIFNSLKDAEHAVDTYHNRQLDGQPMKCLLVNRRASSKPTAPAVKSSRTPTKSKSSQSVEIDIDALHKVLFRRH